MKKLLPKKFILIEGIDGGGKTTFVNFLEKEIKNNFTYSSKRTLSIVGQPFYSLEKNNSLSNMIEEGKISGNMKNDIRKLQLNRQKHEKFLSTNYSGLKICVRGVLTDIATLYAKYGILSNSSVGQGVKIDLLIIIDTPINKALQRIKKRDFIQWREKYTHLLKFKKVYLNLFFIKKQLNVQNIIIIKNKNSLEYLRIEAKKIVRDYIH